MLQLSIPIPSLSGTQEIDIEMTINGQKQKMQFMVQYYQWDDCKSPDPDSYRDRIECIRELVKEYGKEWMIYHIGMPTEDYVPLIFVKTTDWERQRKVMMESVLGRPLKP